MNDNPRMVIDAPSFDPSKGKHGGFRRKRIEIGADRYVVSTEVPAPGGGTKIERVSLRLLSIQVAGAIQDGAVLIGGQHARSL